MPRPAHTGAWSAGSGLPVATGRVSGPTVHRHVPQADGARLAETIRRTSTAQWLCEMGFEHEVDALCEFHSTDVVPRLVDGAFVAE